MTPTNFEINVALSMIAATAFLMVWLRKSEASHSLRRMMSMMRHFSMDPGLMLHGNPEIKAALQVARRRCVGCRVEGFCERWQARKVWGDDDFCPNKKTFLHLR